MLHLANGIHAHPAPTRKASGNPLQINPAQRTLAAVMNGMIPEPEDIAAIRQVHISEQLLHLSTAAALRQALMSRPSTGSRVSDRRRGGAVEMHAIRDAYYLALALAADADGDPSALSSLVGRERHHWLDSAALIGRMQLRFLEQVCAQIDLTANHMPIPATVAPVRASTMLTSGGRITESTTLLPNHSRRESDDVSRGWLHATSTVLVEGYTGSAVVDAGPALLPAAWSARIAAPITITASSGRWPAPVVRDCLWLCQDAVREWVGSMTRQLSGANEEDLLLLVGPPLRRFLTSPAALAIARCVHRMNTHDVLSADLPPSSTSPTESIPLRAAESTAETVSDKRARAELLKTMRQIEANGQELPADIELDDAASISEVHKEELALLTSVRPESLAESIEVTANITVPDWQDVTAAVRALRNGAGAQLIAPVIAYTDQDVVAGSDQCLTLRIRAHQGVPLRTLSGFAVFLAPGTRFTVLGVDRAKNHATVYLDQDIANSVPNASGTVSDRETGIEEVQRNVA